MLFAPDDRVLVAYLPSSADFVRLQKQRWYRIPVAHAPKGLYAEWIAFYFGADFGPQKYAIHYYAANLGHELLRRVDLLPDEPAHPRANQPYYKVQLGALLLLNRPIISLQWRRILFIHTTADRLTTASEINDLFLQGDSLVHRANTILRDQEL